MMSQVIKLVKVVLVFFKLEKNKTQVCLMEGLSYKLSDCPSRLDGNLLFWKKTTFFFISLFLLEASNL